MTELVAMPSERVAVMKERGLARFAEDVAREKGVPVADLLPKLRAHTEELLAADGNRFFDVVADGAPVGWLWVGVDNSPVPDSAFVFDLFIEAEHRGRGHGGAALRALEPLAREIGVARIALSVFAQNTGAIRLYERLGYEVILKDTGGQRMAKTL